MNELNNLQVKELASQNKSHLQAIIDKLTEARGKHDGPAIADAIGELETIYQGLKTLEEAGRRETRDKRLAQTRERFGLGALRENKDLSKMGGTSLGRVIYHLERAIEWLERWLRNLENSDDSQEDTQFFINETGEAIHWGYLICRPKELEAVR